MVKSKRYSPTADLSDASDCDSPTGGISRSPSPSPFDAEAKFYYVGLPSCPRLVARTGTTPWESPTGPEAYHRRKQLGVVAKHKLNTIWEHKVAPKVISCLDEMGVQWTSLDIVRHGVAAESSTSVILWIGVKPKSLAVEDAKTAVFRCLDILKEFGITDVDVEMRESSVIRSAGLTLLPPVSSSEPTAAVRTEDYAITEVDKDKIDRTQFQGNVIDLGTEIRTICDFTMKMRPNYEDSSSFQFPFGGLLKLQGIISDKEMRRPTFLNQKGERCMMVIKDGSTTGVTIGRASGIMSFVREYFENGSHGTSKEWAILPYDLKSGAFSEPGDSGAVVVDGHGRIGGLLTGGAGGTGIPDSLDISYASPSYRKEHQS